MLTVLCIQRARPYSMYQHLPGRVSPTGIAQQGSRWQRDPHSSLAYSLTGTRPNPIPQAYYRRPAARRRQQNKGDKFALTEEQKQEIREAFGACYESACACSLARVCLSAHACMRMRARACKGSRGAREGGGMFERVRTRTREHAFPRMPFLACLSSHAFPRNQHPS